MQAGFWMCVATILFSPTPSRAAGESASPTTEQASSALRAAAAFFRERASVAGSYAWAYAPDLSVRRGEGGAIAASEGWVQPPGTPAVGLAFLRAYDLTGDEYLYEAAIEVAHALARTQLHSGGWSNRIEFDPARRTAWCYRVEYAEERDCTGIEDNPRHNATLLDDNITQSALTLLIELDGRLQGTDETVRDAAAFGLRKLIEAQYPNGAWPSRVDKAVPDELTTSAWRASYPVQWSRTYVKLGDPLYYALNDHIVRDTIRLLLLAHRTYGRPELEATAMRGGDFLLAAQMPEPQAGWAHLYNRDLKPAWGRKFEPPAVVARESAGAIEALLDLYRQTGKHRYLQRVAPAVEWLQGARLPDGLWARFYELQTNRPLYVDRDYRLTYTDDNLPEHFLFKGDFGIPAVLEAYRATVDEERATGTASVLSADTPPDTATPPLDGLKTAIEDLDPAGRWIDDDGWIRSETFIRNLEMLATFIAADRHRSHN
jgi:Pectic acid lyase